MKHSLTLTALAATGIARAELTVPSQTEHPDSITLAS